MKIAFLYSIIFMLTSIIFHTYSMELAFFFPKKEEPYTIQTFPNDVWDKIIAYCSNPARNHLKRTSRQLAYLTSINRLDALIAHNFILGDDEQDKKRFFKTLISTNNPDLLSTIITHAKKEAESYAAYGQGYYFISDDSDESDDDEESYIVIPQPENVLRQEFIEENYLEPLLQQALEQKKDAMVERIKEENYNLKAIETYEKKISKHKSIMCGGSIVFIILSLGVVGVAIQVVCMGKHGYRNCNMSQPWYSRPY